MNEACIVLLEITYVNDACMVELFHHGETSALLLGAKIAYAESRPPGSSGVTDLRILVDANKFEFVIHPESKLYRLMIQGRAGTIAAKDYFMGTISYEWVKKGGPKDTSFPNV